ncbi:hypothetical protein GCM10011519_01100 [Marmoricola endophyticus]|uniref:Peptidase MA superfamily protein n=1 Tax=Marmoricola endophyticus TaxID=2040280 RepID=A0A917B977_9ACTN|nr:hypothetical protein [Marmoricola endophyticus]GGF31528.1 hypothetical protein GCM10011519_01100 [Marmoricola endophyticus]
MAGRSPEGAAGRSRPGRPVPGRLLLAICVLLCLVLGACGGTEITPPRADGDTATRQDAAASDLLGQLAAAVRQADVPAAERLASSGERDRAAAVVRNAAALGLTDVRFRYVSRTGSGTDDGAGASATTQSQEDDRTWDATVAVSWRLPEYDDAPTTLSARFTFVAQGGGARLVDTDAPGERGALWLSGPAAVERTSDTLVLAAAGSAAGTPAVLSERARQAVRDVRKVLPGWSGPLVVEAPDSEQELERLIGARPGSYAAIAAVTTTVDGSKEPGTPVHVYLNPTVFGGLGPRGSQVVLSHEATHVATRASFADLPTWLLEGFADYVALAHADIPFTTAAGQVLSRVRKDGPPTALPDADDLAPSASGLGATYEEAWTACRFLAMRYGERTLVDLYDAVTDGTSVAAAFRSVVGTSQQAFERAWSADLAAQAGDR